MSNRSRKLKTKVISFLLMLACGAALVPAPASSAGYEDAMAWLRAQQEHAQEFRVSIDQGSTSYGEEVLTGEVSNVSELDGERVATPWLSFSGTHSDSYVGPVQGTWGNIAEPEDFRVAVFSETDALYLQGVYPLQTNGTWNSGEGEAHKGRKVATLVRVANEETVAVSGGGHTRIDGVELRIFLRTDVDYLQQVVPLYADGTWTSTSKIASGEVIVRLVNSTTARTINTSEWANATSFEGLLRSFWIPQNDPDYGYEGEPPTRCSLAIGWSSVRGSMTTQLPRSPSSRTANRGARPPYLASWNLSKQKTAHCPSPLTYTLVRSPRTTGEAVPWHGWEPQRSSTRGQLETRSFAISLTS